MNSSSKLVRVCLGVDAWQRIGKEVVAHQIVVELWEGGGYGRVRIVTLNYKI